MKALIAKTEFHKTYLLFERRDSKTIDVRWQVFIGTKTGKKEHDIEYRYKIGTMDFEHKVTDKQMEIYSNLFVDSIECYEAVAKVCNRLSKSKDKIERDFLKKFSNRHLKAVLG